MERKDLLEANGAIFAPQGKALNAHAKRDVKVLVVGNPANTNALIAQQNAPDLDPKCFTAMVRLDHNRALSQLAEKTGAHTTDIRRVTIWGNHSSTQYPGHPPCDRRRQARDRRWSIRHGTRTRSSRPCSSAARRSSRRAALRRRRRPRRRRSITCARGRTARRRATGCRWAIPADGSYGIKPGVIYGYPVTVKNGKYAIVQGLEINAFSRARMDATDKELREERAGVEHLFAK